MKKESLFFTITFSFIISLFLIIASFVVLVRHTQDVQEQHLKRKYLPVAKMVLEQNRTRGLTKEFVDSLSIMNMQFINDVKTMNSILYNPKTKVILGRHFKSILVRVIVLNSESYLLIKNGRLQIMFKDTQYRHVSPLIYLIGVFGVLLLAVVLSFITTWKKLYPLKILKDKVKTLGDENFDFEVLETSQKDEVSQLSQEFLNSARKLKNIKESRNVFIRNIMHELKTPITKGKFLLALDPSKQNEEKMKNVFNRLELLINEFSSIEELISSTKNIERNFYFLGDILDNAIDTLMLDEDIVNFKHENKKLYVNFKLFSVAVKNLLDNAIKYSSDKQVSIRTNEKNEIIFENKGLKLEHDLEKYFEPFFAHDNKSKNSFGLGLYIVNSILSANKFALRYEYKEGINSFIITSLEKNN